ncbi:regulator of G-protein signaling 14 [Nematolebias whitei]|uniref:regulator of G-protein signaling 14 n=1 Tax=Nematolebias whitei TaxID=451745 RepID=UPI0018976D67|nr:regulator of G-protein signaling 14 [Nematolebias whitei]
MAAFRAVYHRFTCLAKFAAQKQHRKYSKLCTLGTGGRELGESQALSDGELNMTARGCGGSSSSLPGTPGGDAGPANSVLSWAVSFEKLLEDPCGVSNFTAFLKSEVSAENILFWQACEKFRKIPANSLDELKAAARSIYNTYLSESAPDPVNIDDTAKTEEKDLEQPTPDMFNRAQTQIFKLMKMDSYRRFVRSPLYQSCTLASVEGKLLSRLSAGPRHMGSWEDVVTNTSSDTMSKKSDSLLGGKRASEKRPQMRGSWGDPSNDQVSGGLKNSHLSVKSTSNVELGALHRQHPNGHSSPRLSDRGGGSGGRVGVEGGYCCVYLPDGSASLAPTRDGQQIKDMLANLCEKRGFPLKDVAIYLNGKNKPLLLDQDCSVLRDQQVTLELWVTFALEIAFTSRTVGIKVKSSKTLQEALSVVMQKHQLRPQETVVTMVGSDEPLNLSSSVYSLANKTIRLDKTKGKDLTFIPKGSASCAATQGGAVSLEPKSSLQADKTRTPQRTSKNRDMDGFLDMLTRAQCCRVDDQRGLLTKEQLEVPSFLQLSTDQAQDSDDPSTTSSSTSDSKTEPEDMKSTSGSAGSDCPDLSESKDFKETTV